jgi:RHS repeat-associated protein
MGNRISQVVASNGTKNYTWYVRDAQGNILSTYSAVGNSSLDSLKLQLADRFIYGSSRLGTSTVNDANIDGDPGNTEYYYEDRAFAYDRGYKSYELTNHLGNVLATVSDRKFGVSSGGSSLIDHYEPHIVTAQDYYPFGMMSRVNLSGKSYTFGFNGKMNDNDVKGGVGNQQDYGMRIYDPRIGKFLSLDPLTKDYPWYTPYQFAGNKPIQFIDLDGLEENGASTYTHKPSPALQNTPKSTIEKSSAGMNLGAFKMNKWSYDGTTWWLPQSKIYTFGMNVGISGVNQTINGLETGSKVFTKDGRKELRKETVKNIFRFFQWIADNADDPMGAVKEKLTDVNTYEDLTAMFLMGRMVNNGLGLNKASTAIKDATASKMTTSYSQAKKVWLECYEIADDINKAVKGGTVYEMRPVEGNWMNGMQYGESRQFTFHQFFVKNGYVYDPMFSDKPMLLKKYIEQYQTLNGGNIKVEPVKPK